LPFIAPDAVIIPTDRQRRKLTDIESLANSIKLVGQIQPIVLRNSPEGLTLVAGERRLAAMKTLNANLIEYTFLEALSESEQTLVELEENIRRQALPWPDEIRAIAKYTALLKEPQGRAAQHLGISESSLSSMMVLAGWLEADPKLELATSWTAAYAIVRQRQNRASAAVLEDIFAEGSVNLLGGGSGSNGTEGGTLGGVPAPGTVDRPGADAPATPNLTGATDPLSTWPVTAFAPASPPATKLPRYNRRLPILGTRIQRQKIQLHPLRLPIRPKHGNK